MSLCIPNGNAPGFELYDVKLWEGDAESIVSSKVIPICLQDRIRFGQK